MTLVAVVVRTSTVRPWQRASCSGNRWKTAFERAMTRAEADLLLADVAAMAGGGYRERTQSQRRVDAILLVMRHARHGRHGGAEQGGGPATPASGVVDIMGIFGARGRRWGAPGPGVPRPVLG